MKTIRRLGLLFFLSLAPVAGMAIPMDYSFDVDWTSGGLAGTSTTVYVTLDSLSGSGEEIFTPSDSPPGQLFSLETTVYGLLYTAADDAPYLRFISGSLVEFNYTAFRGDGNSLLISNDFALASGAGVASSEGTVNFLSYGRETDMGYGAAFHDNLVQAEKV